MSDEEVKRLLELLGVIGLTGIALIEIGVIVRMLWLAL